MTHDPVNHPKHYTSHPSGVECITVTRHHNFNVGNAIKYLWRAGLKGGSNTAIQDLEKAIWYLNDELGRLRAAGAPAEPAPERWGVFQGDELIYGTLHVMTSEAEARRFAPERDFTVARIVHRDGQWVRA